MSDETKMVKRSIFNEFFRREKKTCLCRKVGEFTTDAPHLRDSLKLIFFAKETPKKHIAY